MGNPTTYSYPPDGLSGILRYDSRTSAYTPYAVETDHLGSITALYNSSGTKVLAAGYDAWGKRTVTTGTLEFRRGYTGHEHIDGYDLINMNGRVYDPLIGRFLSPDPFIQLPDFSQSFNRYSYCLNNPLKYTDPEGKFIWIPIIIGAAMGGISGYMIGNESNATGLDMVGYIVGGTLIGGLSSGAACGISLLGGGAMFAGAGAGIISGAGFSGLATNWNGDAMISGAVVGLISGFIGGGVGAAIGGGVGAFAGGAVGSGLSTAMNGGDTEEILLSAGLGGTLSYGIYEVTSNIAWKSGGNKIGDYDISYKQYKTMQADMQRSSFWHREYGGILTTDGDVVRAPINYREKYGVNFDPKWTKEAKGMEMTTYHTHWDRPGRPYIVDDNVYRTSKGPSWPVDYRWAELNNMQNILIDRYQSYLYWGDEVNCFCIKYGYFFSMRYFPFYLLLL